jgi:hypothetical protein
MKSELLLALLLFPILLYSQNSESRASLVHGGIYTLSSMGYTTPDQDRGMIKVTKQLFQKNVKNHLSGFYRK